jgi:hypothetical protein
MIEQSKDGGPAFPCDPQMMRVSEDGSIEAIGFRGMSLRDWFAGQSLAGINASRETFLAILKDRGRQDPLMSVASAAYSMADAMLAARSTPPAAGA